MREGDAPQYVETWRNKLAFGILLVGLAVLALGVPSLIIYKVVRHWPTIRPILFGGG